MRLVRKKFWYRALPVQLGLGSQQLQRVQRYSQASDSTNKQAYIAGWYERASMSDGEKSIFLGNEHHEVITLPNAFCG